MKNKECYNTTGDSFMSTQLGDYSRVFNQGAAVEICCRCD